MDEANPRDQTSAEFCRLTSSHQECVILAYLKWYVETGSFFYKTDRNSKERPQNKLAPYVNVVDYVYQNAVDLQRSVDKSRVDYLNDEYASYCLNISEF